MRRTLPFVCVLFVMLLLPLDLIAQDASLRGVVTDSTGAVLPNAIVILMDTFRSCAFQVDSELSA